MSDTFDHEWDALEELLYGEGDDGDYVRPKKCNICGMAGLYWIKTDYGWRLGKCGVEHKCSNSAAESLLKKLLNKKANDA